MGYAGTEPAVSVAAVAILQLCGTPRIALHAILRVRRLAKHRLAADSLSRYLRHIACYAVVGTRRMMWSALRLSVQHGE
jgi:hypothetical protein